MADTLPPFATLGAWRRANGHPRDGMCDEAKNLYAFTLADQARRRLLIDRLDGITRFLVVGATCDQAIARLTRLVDELTT